MSRVRIRSTEQLYAIVQARLNYECISAIHEETRVSTSTLYKWRDKKVARPQAHALESVGKYLGYRLEIR